MSGKGRECCCGPESGNGQPTPTTALPTLAIALPQLLELADHQRIIAIGETAFTLAVCTTAGYALAKLPLRGSKALLNYFIVLLLVPRHPPRASSSGSAGRCWPSRRTRS